MSILDFSSVQSALATIGPPTWGPPPREGTVLKGRNDQSKGQLTLRAGQIVDGYTVVDVNPRLEKGWKLKKNGKEFMTNSQWLASKLGVVMKPPPPFNTPLQRDGITLRAGQRFMTDKGEMEIIDMEHHKNAARPWKVRFVSGAKDALYRIRTNKIAKMLGIPYKDPHSLNQLCDPDNPSRCFTVNQTFVVNGKNYTITGIKKTRGKRPFRVSITKDGVTLKTSALSMAKMIDMNEPTYGRLQDIDPNDPLKLFYDPSEKLYAWTEKNSEIADRSNTIQLMESLARLYPSVMVCLDRPIADAGKRWTVSGGLSFGKNMPDSVRFSITCLRFVKSKSAHANALVYDKHSRVLVRFEPHGIHIQKDRVLDAYFTEYAKTLLPGTRYFGPGIFQQLSGPQGRDGTCSVYSLMFAHHFLIRFNEKLITEPLAELVDIIDKYFKLKTGNRVESNQRRYSSLLRRNNGELKPVYLGLPQVEGADEPSNPNNSADEDDGSSSSSSDDDGGNEDDAE